MKIEIKTENIWSRDYVNINLNYDEFLDLKSVLEKIKEVFEPFEKIDEKDKTDLNWVREQILFGTTESRIIKNLTKKMKED